MASARAIPIIAITRILPKALGLRPTASAAFPPQIPTPIPAPKPAKASGSIGPKLGPAAASAANIGRISNIISLFLCSRWCFAFLFPPPTLVMVSTEKLLMPVFSFSRIRRKFNVNGAEHREDKSLQQPDQQFEKVK